MGSGFRKGAEFGVQACVVACVRSGGGQKVKSEYGEQGAGRDCGEEGGQKLGCGAGEVLREGALQYGD